MENNVNLYKKYKNPNIKIKMFLLLLFKIKNIFLYINIKINNLNIYKNKYHLFNKWQKELQWEMTKVTFLLK